ncbi:MAG: sensor histidine kinase [Acidobacteriota bacterium]
MRSPWLRSRRSMPLWGLLAAGLLLVAAFILGLVSFGKMRQVVGEEFNEQQLVLARNLATLIRQDLDFLRRELMALNQSPLAESDHSATWERRMRVTFDAVQSGELLEIRLVSPSGKDAYILLSEGEVLHEKGDFSQTTSFLWASRPENRGKVLLISSSLPVEGDLDRRRPRLVLAVPHYHALGGYNLHDPSGRIFAGVLEFTVDATALATRFTADARSGTTGYAWVLDEMGTFLAHPEKDFLGKNAFKARHEKNPKLAFEGINVIMRDHMLRGQEGKGEYLSGWHRQLKGPVHKLIGYTAAHLDPERPDLFWSVAVVAPASEVQGMVRSLFLRQFTVQTAIFLAILAGSVSVIRRDRWWSKLQKEKERQINLSSRLASLGTLAAGVAHEVNNPIAIILGFCDLLLEKVPPGSQEYEHLKIIEKQALACKKIVENLGRFARIPEQRAETSDLNEEVRRVLAMVRNTLLTEKIQCVLDLEEGIPPVSGDPQGLQQVFLNLITNARAAMKSGGTLTIQTRRMGSRAVTSVSDTGHGIAKQDLERIFDPFFTTKAPGEGTGLGLSISHGIVEKAGGSIQVESRHVDAVGEEHAGSTFRVVLPLAPSGEEAHGPAGGAA